MTDTLLFDAKQTFQQRIDKIAFIRFNKPYDSCNISESIIVVDKAHKQIQFALDENAIKLAKLGVSI